MIKKKILEVLVNAGYHKGKSGEEKYFFLSSSLVYFLGCKQRNTFGIFFLKAEGGGRRYQLSTVINDKLTFVDN